MYSTIILYYVYYTTMEPVHSSTGDPALRQCIPRRWIVGPGEACGPRTVLYRM
jgi:hypothetical protein